ncbi:MAG: hypothetical protein WBV87_15500 [Candidatus Acidiferrales bacterium]
MRIFSIRRARKSLGISSALFLAAALFAILFTASTASAQVVLSVAIAPPALPVYTQPVCPGAGFIWTPGYWSYSDDGGYFWVPGTWVEAPEVGFLWTPGYWGWNSGSYVWNAGYWGPQVGFYGGINYGFGYTGVGYAGGYWRDRQFYYNSRVNNVNVTVVHNVYQKTVVVHSSHVSYNGGHGGISARPTATQEKFAHERHTGPTSVQEQHVSEARSDRNQFASVNHGRPAVVATQRPGEFKGAGVVQAKASASDRLNANRTETRSRTESRTEAKPRAESKPAEAREPKTETKPRAESKPATTHEPKTESHPREESRPATTHEEPKTESKPRTESKPATTHEPKTESKPRTEPKPATTHEPKTESRPRTESKPAETHEPKTEAKPREESRPATTHESKPPAQHEAKPPAQHEQHESAPHEEKPKR